MILAQMLSLCEDDFICDMAETYHVLSWRDLPLKTAAILASGLPESSRIKRKLRNEKLQFSEIMSTAILDQLRMLTWLYASVHSKKKLEQPASVLERLNRDRPENRVTGFDTPEAFEKRRKEILRGA